MKLDNIKKALPQFGARKPVIASMNLPQVSATADDQKIPRLVVAETQEISLETWIASHREWIETTLKTCGAVLFRGFSPIPEDNLGKITSALIGPGGAYLYRSTPRTEVAKGIYTATEYPADQRIPLHNENSYQSTWPGFLFFFCVRAAASGGETPLADMRRVLRRLSPELADRFTKFGILYVRNYYRNSCDGPDLPWTTVFQTDSKEAVEEYCQTHGIQFSWSKDDRLRTWQQRPAVIEHPESREAVWFNQAHLFHISALPEPVRISLLDLYLEDELPRNALLGNGMGIPIEDLTEIRAAIDAETVLFPWKDNDALLLDNMLIAHGRMPYEGKRRVLVAFGPSRIQ